MRGSQWRKHRPLKAAVYVAGGLFLAAGHKKPWIAARSGGTGLLLSRFGASNGMAMPKTLFEAPSPDTARITLSLEGGSQGLLTLGMHRTRSNTRCALALAATGISPLRLTAPLRGARCGHRRCHPEQRGKLVAPRIIPDQAERGSRLSESTDDLRIECVALAD